MITLYGITRSRAARCLWMLEELGLPYERVPIDQWKGQQKTPEYAAINPNARVPALTDDGTVLFESLAINLYLAEKYGAGLWPKSVEDRGRAYQWSIWAMTEVESHALDLLRNRVLFEEAKRDESAAGEAEQALRRPFAVLEGRLEQPYLLGDAFSVADLNVAAVSSWARLGRMKLEGFPRMKDWLGRCLERPAFKKAMSL